MSRRSVDPRLNASLIREGRMIFQQLQQIFGSGREPRSTSYNDVLLAREQAKAAKAPALKCAVCLTTSEVERDAITIANGDALCAVHLVSASKVL